MLIKRFLDIFLSLIVILITIPLFVLISILVYFKLGRPIIFMQPRVGKNGRIFKMYKFRTMLDRKDESGCMLSDEERLTNFGKILRSTSIDELPELINVLWGNMSLVGPRPLLVEYLTFYNESQSKRHNARPGITGWAQINGRNSINWTRKFELDVWYVENWSLWLDFKIMLITIIKVVTRDGISQQGNITVDRFNGFN